MPDQILLADDSLRPKLIEIRLTLKFCNRNLKFLLIVQNLP